MLHKRGRDQLPSVERVKDGLSGAKDLLIISGIASPPILLPYLELTFYLCKSGSLTHYKRPLRSCTASEARDGQEPTTRAERGVDLRRMDSTRYHPGPVESSGTTRRTRMRLSRGKGRLPLGVAEHSEISLMEGGEGPGIVCICQLLYMRPEAETVCASQQLGCLPPRVASCGDQPNRTHCLKPTSAAF